MKGKSKDIQEQADRLLATRGVEFSKRYNRSSQNLRPLWLVNVRFCCCANDAEVLCPHKPYGREVK